MLKKTALGDEELDEVEDREDHEVPVESLQH